MSKKPEGVMALTYTALNNDYTLNESALRREIDWVIDKGACGIWPAGFAGEWAQLDLNTRKQHLKICQSQAQGRVYAAAGCHATSTLQAIELINYADSLGYDCAWVSPTTPRRATEEEIKSHYRMILAETTIPLALYNCFPVGNYMSPSLIGEIASMSNRFVAMKAMVSDFTHIAGLYNAKVHDKLSIFGVEWNMMPHLLLGAAGVLAGSDWIPVVVAAYKAFKRNDLETALKLQKAVAAQSPLLIPQIAGLTVGAKVPHSGVGYLKARFVVASGIDLGPPLPPYQPASAEEMTRAREGVEKLNALLAELNI